MEALGPNTNAPRDLLQAKSILCGGEDRDELLTALQRTGTRAILSHFVHRSYEFWRFGDFTLMLCAIGTGCLEPLLWEVLAPGLIRQIVLVGTAGLMPGALLRIGRACVVEAAWSAGTGIDGELVAQPLRPRWDFPWNVPGATSVSTDFYYGFSPRVTGGSYPLTGGRLGALYKEHLQRGTQMVDMEVAQFYCFCDRFGAPDLQYLAIKAPANAVDSQEEQLLNTGSALTDSLSEAFRLLSIDA